MKPFLITFDCAQTLVEVNWRVGEFAVTCAEHCGLELGDAAALRYAGLYQERLKEYLAANLTRDRRTCEDFWDRLTRDWLDEQGHDPSVWHQPLRAASRHLGFSPKSIVFKVYEDVIPLLDLLKSHGVRTAVISNWDYSLHDVLEAMDLTRRFDMVIASLEEGFEKPDPRIFQLALEKFRVKPQHAVHIGDDPIDDLQGARAVGMRALLLDRNVPSPHGPPYIKCLQELPGAIGWRI